MKSIRPVILKIFGLFYPMHLCIIFQILRILYHWATETVVDISIYLFLGLDDFIQAHITKTRPKSCTICGYSAADSRDVGRHIESKHINLEIMCRYCGTILKNRRSFGGHLKSRHLSGISQNDVNNIINLHVRDMMFNNSDIIH